MDLSRDQRVPTRSVILRHSSKRKRKSRRTPGTVAVEKSNSDSTIGDYVYKSKYRYFCIKSTRSFHSKFSAATLTSLGEEIRKLFTISASY